MALERARQAQEEGREFLRQTLDRRRKQEAAEGEKHRAHLEKRMKALLSLKSNIESSKVCVCVKCECVKWCESV